MLLDITILQSDRKGRNYFAMRDAVEVIKKALFNAPAGDIAVTLVMK